MKPEEVTDEMMLVFYDEYKKGGMYDTRYRAGIAAAITVYLRDAGRGQCNSPGVVQSVVDVLERINNPKEIGSAAVRGEITGAINVLRSHINADRATPAASSPVIHKFGDQYVAVCGDDSVNHKTTEFWEYVTCKDCLKKGTATPAEATVDSKSVRCKTCNHTRGQHCNDGKRIECCIENCPCMDFVPATPAEATGDGWTYYKPAEGSCFRNRHRVKGETVEEYYRKKWMPEIDQAKDIFFDAIRDGKIILDPIQTESGEPAPTPADPPSDAMRFEAKNISDCIDICKDNDMTPITNGAMKEILKAIRFDVMRLAELRKVAGK